MPKGRSSESEKRAIASLKRALPDFTAWRKEWLGEEKKREEAEALRAVANNEIGYKMPDGTIYLGLYGGKDWFAAPEDAQDKNGKKRRMSFNNAARYAKKLKACGHDDWMMPPAQRLETSEPDILGMLYEHRNKGAFSGTFNQTGVFRSDHYWSGTQANIMEAYERDLNSGKDNWNHVRFPFSVRCVRAVPRLK